jgi:hypothetical protein
MPGDLDAVQRVGERFVLARKGLFTGITIGRSRFVFEVDFIDAGARADLFAIFTATSLCRAVCA